MKTTHYLITIISLIIQVALFGQSQQNKVMTRLSDRMLETVKNENGKIWFEQREINQLFSQLSVTSVQQAFPASKKEELQSVVEISCACDVNTLLAEVAKRKDYFEQPELVPAITPLHETNDYTAAFATDYALDLINAKEAWDVTTGNRRIKIAITDSNFDLNHEELAGKYSYIQPGMYNPNYDHGTAVAITAAGNTNNGVGKSSIGYDCDLLLYGMSYNSILDASYAGAHVINVSWAGGCVYSSYYQDMINEVLENGSVIVAAAGNGGTCGDPSSLVYPAAYDGVISVSSIGPNDNHERYIGDASSTHQHNATVDLVAPGYDMALSIANNVYTTGNGTSFASPIVSGTVGLMKEVNEALNHCEVEYILKSTAVSIDSLNPGYEGLLGAGRLDAAGAVETAAAFDPTWISHTINYHYLDPNGAIFVNVESELPVASFDYTFDSYSSANGEQVRIYTVDVIYETGCVFTKKHLISEGEFLDTDSLLALPVTLTAFDAEIMKEDILVYWETESENNSAYYDVEKSIDGKEWEVIGYREAAGASHTTNYYELTDFNPNSGIQYYRLIQVDNNGERNVGGVVSVDYGSISSDKDSYVYPNPSNGQGTLVLAEGAKSVQVFSAAGVLEQSFDVAEGAHQQIYSEKSGMKMIRVLFDTEEVKTTKWVVD